MLPLIFPVSSHSHRCGKGSTFVAIQGLVQDGISYIEDALNRGATTIVVSRDAYLDPAVVVRMEHDGIELVRVDNTRLALAQLSAQAAGYQTKKLKLIGITGTKGKTTTTFMTHEILRQAGYATALISTVHNSIGDQILATNMTTPQPDYLHQFFVQCVAAGVEYVVMETAAQAMTFDRIAGLEYAVVAFTNLEREHAELYPTMTEYFDAKKQLFDCVAPDGVRIVNGDDEYGNRLAAAYSCNRISMHDTNAAWYGTCTPSTVQPNTWHMTLCGTQAGSHIAFDYQKFHGTFNGYNIMTALAIADACGVPLDIAAHAIQQMPSIAGRFEHYALSSGVHVVIDYAHTPASFEALFKTVRPMTNHLTVVFGAGGGKDPVKRPLMGKLAAQYADRVVVTTDNPRFESPEAIVRDIMAGIASVNQEKVMIIADRQQAIEQVLQAAPAGSYVLLLGKGPDEYQEVQGVEIPFSEKAIVQRFV